MKKLIRNLVFGLLLASAAWAMTGCATDEPENMSSRPWNSPRGWETGLPSTFNDGR